MENEEIILADYTDLEQLITLDKHISKNELQKSIQNNRIYVIKKQENIVAWLRYNLFWDNIPFVNMLYVLEDYRNKNLGRNLMTNFERDMKANGYNFVMTSSLSNEQAQYFYRKLEYKDIGSLLLPNEPLEIIFGKEI